MNMMNKYVDLEHVVEESGLASTMKSGSLAVLATPQLAAWMEEAACACLGQADDLGTTPEEQEAMTTVGVKLDLDHLKASPLGATIKVRATLIKVDGRKLEFWCEAWQGEDLLGQASHKRVMVDAEKFVNKTYGFKQ
ncbi:hotdog domain-containing protein [uncultured Faecalibaculum sp.]|uniref:thioesterase family protein n=1 Tax=uncultured Faecalibaculum sp. TaxID=1729681 RepID=UPI0026162CF2|nr:hotdog domain-containing protein [uncultured Faecalibaculum sp.]